MGSGKYLKRSILKHGIENFRKDILYVFSTEAEMNTKESELVHEEFVSWSNTYNICVGGQGGFSYVNKTGLNNRNDNHLKAQMSRLELIRTDNDFRKKVQAQGSANLKAAHLSGKIRHDTFTGKQHTSESKEKMSSAKIGKYDGNKNPSYGTCWIYNNVTLENKKIVKNDLDLWLNVGYTKGRIMRGREPGILSGS